MPKSFPIKPNYYLEKITKARAELAWARAADDDPVSIHHLELDVAWWEHEAAGDGESKIIAGGTARCPINLSLHPTSALRTSTRKTGLASSTTTPPTASRSLAGITTCPSPPPGCNVNPDGHDVNRKPTVYTASKTCHSARWRELRDHGDLNIISSWIDLDDEPTTENDWATLWSCCANEATLADCCLVYL